MQSDRGALADDEVVVWRDPFAVDPVVLAVIAQEHVDFADLGVRPREPEREVPVDGAMTDLQR